MTAMTDDNSTEVSQDLLEQAAQAESAELSGSPALLLAQNQHYQQRVVVLRAHVLRLQAENEELKRKLTRLPQDRQAKKTTPKKKA